MSGFAYAQARMQARYGARLDDAAWNRLEAVPDFELFLKQTRETTMAPWVSAIDTDIDIHTMENRLEEFFGDFIMEIAKWAPGPWRPAIALTAELFTLPTTVQQQKQPSSRKEILDGWLARWRTLIPDGGKNHKGLQDIVALVERFDAKFVRLETSEQAADSRRELKSAMELRFRRHATTPAALFAFLLLFAIDFERLRGGLSRRLLFANAGKGG